ncbi:S41 family peptidase [Candidatus Uhrbacteria bacterium]|nr:S41 family peptidase [Candidatus Uhrbacteria bacterium]
MLTSHSMTRSVARRILRKLLWGYITASLVIMSFLGGFLVSSKQTEPVREGVVIDKAVVPADLSKDVDFNQFWEVWNLARTQFVHQPVPEVKLFYGALKGMVAALEDPYSLFLEPVTARKFNEELAGSFSGIGAEVGVKNDRVTIISPLPDTPAERAGLRSGDAVLAIDGEDTAGMTIDLAVSKIRGPKGTKVKLLIGRAGVKQPFEVEITRDQIEVKSVRTQYKDGVAIIKITHFGEDTARNFDRAVREVLSKDAKAIILDLRSNPGGFLDSAVAVTGEWIENDAVLIERMADGAEREYKSDGRSRLGHLPTVVLINEGSASGSEILAGALQDYGKAKLVGKKTFGKGSVQDYQQFRDGSALKITVAEWLTPKKNFIDKKGIAPDVEVELTEEDYNANRDPQLDKALDILKEQLK